MDDPADPPASPSGEARFDKEEFRSRRRRRLRKVEVVLAVVLIVVGGLGWVTDGFTRSGRILDSLGPQCPPTVALNGSGSTVVLPLMQAWVQAYEGGAASRNRGCAVVAVSYNSSGADAGLTELDSRSTGFAATEEPLTPAMEATFPSPTLTLPIALSAVAIAYHLPGVASGLDLTGPVLAAIYLGTITWWNDSAIEALNPSVTLPSGLPITVVHANPGSTTTFVFTSYLSEVNSTWASTVGTGASVTWPVGVGATGDAGEASLVASTTGTIAYLGLYWTWGPPRSGP